MNIGEINEISRPMGLSGKFPPKGKFTSQQIATLRKEYQKIGSVDPSSKTYDKLTEFLDSLSLEMLKQLATAKIKFISGLALNRVVKRGGSIRESVEESPEEILDMRFSEADEPTLDEGVDEVAARELTLYIENDSTIYRQRIQPIIKNLARKMKKEHMILNSLSRDSCTPSSMASRVTTRSLVPDSRSIKLPKRKVAEDLRDNFMDEIEDAV